MQKIKNAFYEHRFGLFFFVFLMVYSFCYANGMPSKIEGITYSIYAMDFSVGFCTRLLPGAVFNFLFGDANVTTVSLYYYVLLFTCFFCLSWLAEKLFKIFEEKDRTNGFAMTMFLIMAFCVCSFVGRMFELLDLHWYIAAIAFFFCLTHKKLYIFIPLTFLCAIMCHYASAICYIPMFVLVLLYKIICSENKKEKTILSIVLGVSFILSVTLFGYMQLFELSNVKYTMEEFIDFLKARGVRYFNYYVYPLYRTVPEGIEWIFSPEMMEKYDIIEVDFSQPKLVVMLQTIAQQIQINLAISGHGYALRDCIIYIPLVVFVAKTLIDMLKNKRGAKLKKFVYFNSCALFVFVIVFGFLSSTDTTRWFGHATIIFCVLNAYFVYKEEFYRYTFLENLNKVPISTVIIYFILLTNVTFIYY